LAIFGRGVGFQGTQEAGDCLGDDGGGRRPEARKERLLRCVQTTRSTTRLARGRRAGRSMLRPYKGGGPEAEDAASDVALLRRAALDEGRARLLLSRRWRVGWAILR